MYYFLEKLRSFLVLILGRLRAYSLKFRGTHVGDKVTVARHCSILRPWALKLGERVTIESDVYIKIVRDDAILHIGDYSFVGRGCEFDVLEKVLIGAHTLIAPGCFITDHSHGVKAKTNIDEQPCDSAPVSIGNGVWLGANCVILPGVTIGDGAVVGANSVVTKDIQSMDIVAGAPAARLRSRLD